MFDMDSLNGQDVNILTDYGQSALSWELRG